MKIGLTGPHSSGKTTLLNALHSKSELSGIDFLPEITRQIKERGFDINEAGTLDTQILVMAAHVNNLLLHSRFIVDRSLMDGVVYTEYLYEEGKVPQWFMDYCYSLLDEYIDRYDIIFYLPPEIPLADDRVRSTAKQFHEGVCRIFDKHIQEVQKRYPNLITVVRGNGEQRIKIVQDAINHIKENK